MIALIVSSLLAAGAVEENAAGMKLYQQKKYALALERFQAAIADEKSELPSVKEQVAHTRARALAEFNLACTLALLRKAGKVCEHNAYRDTIMEHVLASIQLDPNRLEKALTDADLQSVRDTIAYQGLLGLSFSREADLAKLLPRIPWSGASVGAYGSLSSLAFKADGTVRYDRRVVSDDGFPGSTRTLQGKWVLTGRTLRITFTKPGEPPLEFTVMAAGRLEGSAGHFTDSPSECDA